MACVLQPVYTQRDQVKTWAQFRHPVDSGKSGETQGWSTYSAILKIEYILFANIIIFMEIMKEIYNIKEGNHCPKMMKKDLIIMNMIYYDIRKIFMEM